MRSISCVSVKLATDKWKSDASFRLHAVGQRVVISQVERRRKRNKTKAWQWSVNPQNTFIWPNVFPLMFFCLVFSSTLRYHFFPSISNSQTDCVREYQRLDARPRLYVSECTNSIGRRITCQVYALEKKVDAQKLTPYGPADPLILGP